MLSVDVAIDRALRTGADAMGLTLTEAQRHNLLDYLVTLLKWGAIHNLTAACDPPQMVTRHLLDSLSLLPYVNADSLLDVGSGAGLPGVPLAIIRPDMKVTLLDSHGKKTRFLTCIRSRLQLENVTVVQCRVEAFHPLRRYAVVTSRAFAPLGAFVARCAHLCRPDGEIVAMLGKAPARAERIALGERLLAVVPITVPGIDGARHIARVRP